MAKCDQVSKNTKNHLQLQENVQFFHKFVFMLTTSKWSTSVVDMDLSLS